MKFSDPDDLLDQNLLGGTKSSLRRNFCLCLSLIRGPVLENPQQRDSRPTMRHEAEVTSRGDKAMEDSKNFGGDFACVSPNGQ